MFPLVRALWYLLSLLGRSTSKMFHLCLSNHPFVVKSLRRARSIDVSLGTKWARSTLSRGRPRVRMLRGKLRGIFRTLPESRWNILRVRSGVRGLWRSVCFCCKETVPFSGAAYVPLYRDQVSRSSILIVFSNSISLGSRRSMISKSGRRLEFRVHRLWDAQPWWPCMGPPS